MTDFYDRAQALEQLQRDAAIDAHFAGARAAGDSLSHCEDCGDPIPAARQRIVPGCTRCVPCQQWAER